LMVIHGDDMCVFDEESCHKFLAVRF
jgi:hypothetical protein